MEVLSLPLFPHIVHIGWVDSVPMIPIMLNAYQLENVHKQIMVTILNMINIIVGIG